MAKFYSNENFAISIVKMLRHNQPKFSQPVVIVREYNSG